MAARRATDKPGACRAGVPGLAHTMPSLSLYMSSAACTAFAAGEPSIFSRLAEAFRSVGWRVAAREDGDTARQAAIADPDHAIFQMVEPPNRRALCLRRAYHYPFWRLENTNERWNFDVARAPFDPTSIDTAEARPFATRWRKRLWGDRVPTRDGFLLMPLQGRLADHRSFQSASPLAMIETTLAHDSRPLVATLHPGEAYSQAERDALQALASRYPRLTIANGTSDDLLAACDLVVTQNSSLAFKGYLMGKPAVLFAGCDFHHIGASVPHVGVAEAFRRARFPVTEADRYLFWFWQIHALNAGRDDIAARILARAADHGWPVHPSN